MTQHIHQSPLYVPEYTGASILLHAGCLALLFLNLHYYTSQQKSIPTAPEPATKKEPRVIMKRVPVNPTPKIAEEQEAQTSTDVTPQQQETKPEPIATPTEKVIHQIQKSVESSAEFTMQTHEAISELTHTEEQTASVQRRVVQKIQQAQRVKRSKMQHSWYAQQKSTTTTTSTSTTEQRTTTTSAAIIQEMTARIFNKPSSTLSHAQQAAENFKRDFQEAAVNDYISAIHHAIAFSLNRKRIMLSPAEIPPQIIMQITITKQGAITYTNVFIPAQDNPSLTQAIKQAILEAAPFRPFPPSITTAELNLAITAYPDGNYAAAARQSSRPTPLMFTLSNNARGGL